MGLSGRRKVIVEAALGLLAEVPLAQLTTRDIARRVGVSQPALFRHFASREQILLAAVEHVRGQLAEVAAAVLEVPLPAEERLARLAEALLRHVEAHPGLPRLLFSDLPEADEVGRALRLLVASQVALVAELVRAVGEEGPFAAAIAPEDAATLFVGMVQGLVLQWQLTGRRASLAARAPALCALFRAGVRGDGRAPGETGGPAREPPPTETPTRRLGLRALDVRPILARGVDPLATILEAVDAVGPGGVVAIEAPFEPRPLLALLRGRGHRVTCEPLGGRDHAIEIVVGGTPEPLDLRDLEPPEPLERVLEETARLARGQVLVARVPRHPRLLLPRLAERGLESDVHERSDGAAVLRVRRPA